jgi:hypothetical protein
MLTITIAFRRIKVGNLGSQLKNKKYGEKYERQAYRLNLHPTTNHGSCKSQFRIWPLWRPYFHKPRFTFFTIHLTNLYAS